MHRTALRARVRAGLVSASLLLTGTATAEPVVLIGNGPDVCCDYINAGSLANTLAFTSVTIAADATVQVDEAIDVSTGMFGPALFDLFLQAPQVAILGDVTMGAGSVYLNGSSIDLAGVLRATDLTPLDTTRLDTTATTINVSAGGSAVQASDLAFTNGGNPVQVSVSGGSESGFVNVWTNMSLALTAGFIENVTLQGAGSVFDWYGGQLGDAGIFGFGGIANLWGTGFQIAPFVVCSTLPESAWVAAPATLPGGSGCVRGQLQSGEAFLVSYRTNGTINFNDVGPVVPVPAALWLFAGALGGLAGLRRRGARA
jgi:hypothetical protein